jgi:hypothetical protein
MQTKAHPGTAHADSAIAPAPPPRPFALAEQFSERSERRRPWRGAPGTDAESESRSGSYCLWSCIPDHGIPGPPRNPSPAAVTAPSSIA